MCGFAGFWIEEGHRAKEDVLAALESMAAKIVHRGPDGCGYWFEESGIAFAHRRLAVLDLSDAGRQPMVSDCQRYVLVFNGEIYNHLDLRRELDLSRKGPTWRGHSDTETFLACISAWGVENATRRLLGMFAFALWDREERKLILGRDRLGEKPLYYGWQRSVRGDIFYFASDLAAIVSHPDFGGEVDLDAVSLYAKYGYIPAPHSIYKRLKKLLPGSLTVVVPRNRGEELIEYWSHHPFLRVEGEASGASEEEVALQLEGLLQDAVNRQMLADVPVGAFLSGGVDSSLIVALMRRCSGGRVKTFTIGFGEKAYNEANYARRIASHLDVDHTEMFVSPQEAMRVIPNLPEIYTEPFADSSQIPTYLVAKLARQHVTVALSGDGGDELFGGYNRHIVAHEFWPRLNRVPASVRGTLGKVILSIPPEIWDRFLGAVAPILSNSLRFSNAGEKIHKSARAIAATTVDELYNSLVTQWKIEDLILHPRSSLESRGAPSELRRLSPPERMMIMDAIGYLPDDILVKVDRAAMAASLETRAPYLDHRVVEMAYQIPLSLKIGGGVGKKMLRKILYKYVPKDMIERPKMGFGVPIDVWLRGPLREWAEDLLSPARLRQEGYFNADVVRKKWSEHLTGKANAQHQLWLILMFQAWLDRWRT